MPYPAQINPERILDQARSTIEAGGPDQLSLHKLAAALGVKAPSLYRYFPNKTALLRALNLQTVQQLIASMQQPAAAGADARTRLRALAAAWHAFGLAYPQSYALAFTHPDPELRPDARLLESLAIPIQGVMAEISGQERSLAALRGLWALIHGFLLLELSGQFRRGGSLEAAFFQAVDAFLGGWSFH